MRFAEVVDSVESLKEFMEVNQVIPREIIVVWDEKFWEDEKSESYKKAKKSIKRLREKLYG